MKPIHEQVSVPRRIYPVLSRNCICPSLVRTRKIGKVYGRIVVYWRDDCWEFGYSICCSEGKDDGGSQFSVRNEDSCIQTPLEAMRMAESLCTRFGITVLWKDYKTVDNMGDRNWPDATDVPEVPKKYDRIRYEIRKGKAPWRRL
jgi:hypothetical protein